MNRNGGERLPYTRASVNFRKRSSPFTDDYNPLSGRHLRVKAFENRKVHQCIFRNLITDNKHTGEGKVKAYFEQSLHTKPTHTHHLATTR